MSVSTKSCVLWIVISEQGWYRLSDLLKFLVCSVVAALLNFPHLTQSLEIISEWVSSCHTWSASYVSKKLVWYCWGTTNTMSDLQVIGRIKKLNNNNYNTWTTCMMFYLQGQDLWKVVGGSEITPPEEDANGTLCNWKIKANKTMHALKTTTKEEMLEHIRDNKMPKEAWDTFVTLFFFFFWKKKNDTRLQLLENRYYQSHKHLATFEYLVEFATYLCLVIYPTSLTRKQSSIYLLDMTTKEKEVFDPTSGRCYTSRDVAFDEALKKKVLPFSNNIEEILQ